MLITDSFVMLNYPKTGSSFARKVIKDLYAGLPRPWFKRRYCRELILPNIHSGVPDQHGAYSQIPQRYRRHECMSIVRNPFDRFLSLFEFRYWGSSPLLPREFIRDRWPTFPNLTLDEYVDYDAAVAERYFKLPQVGTQTAGFMRMFGQFPSLAFGPIAKVTFLRHENLRTELRDFLHRKGFTSGQTAFIDAHEPVNVTSGRSQKWTPKALSYVASAEAVLFEIFATHGIDYRRPVSLAA